MNSLKKYRAWKTSLQEANQDRQSPLKQMDMTDMISAIFELKSTYEGLTTENAQLKKDVELMKHKVGQTLSIMQIKTDQVYHQ